ncbi:hypothetical protein TRVL_06848 [Trypanosoma vivax]|nr:hypothetical protein TRVL_06848 [Trypanosoma vivax]
MGACPLQKLSRALFNFRDFSRQYQLLLGRIPNILFKRRSPLFRQLSECKPLSEQVSPRRLRGYFGPPCRTPLLALQRLLSMQQQTANTTHTAIRVGSASITESNFNFFVVLKDKKQKAETKIKIKT